MAEEEWNTKIRKWGRGINLDDATEDELLEYVQTKLYQYALDKTSDENLWDLFQDDFKDFTVAVFGRLHRRELLQLRSHLRCSGVFVATNTKHMTIAQTLVNDSDRNGLVWSGLEVKPDQTNCFGLV